MTKPMKAAVAIMTAVIFAASPAAVLAYETKSYEQLSPNGKYLFVMLAKGTDMTKVDTLKKKYSHSGLYKANNANKPLWRINWYASTVHISSDGIHLVRVGRPIVEAMNGKPDMEQLALAFYKNGSQTRKYLIRDLIAKPSRLVKSGKGFKWQERIAFDDDSGKLEITLVTGQTKVFSVKSGKSITDKANNKKRRQ
ncbi:MAG: hypothetical protein PHI58_05485 [Candidatus Omnitrophica bacterium]|nr:hypothetical protein [Candidatus Omnitrophota bacterium]